MHRFPPRSRHGTQRSGGTRAAADSGMTVLALAFESPPDAHRALLAARRLHEQRRVALHDVVVVSAEHGPAKVVESMDPSPVAAAVPSTLLGMIVGSLVAGPLGLLIGGAVAGATGALVVRLVDTGVPHRIVAMLCKRAKPGQAVVALLLDERSVEQRRSARALHRQPQRRRSRSGSRQCRRVRVARTRRSRPGCPCNADR